MSRMDFPSTNLVAGTTTHTVGNNTWSWNGYAWTKDCCGYGPTGSTGSVGATGATGANGVTGATGGALGPNPYTTIIGALSVGSKGQLKKGSSSSVHIHKFDDANKDLRDYWNGSGSSGYLYIIDEDDPSQYVLFNYTSDPTYNGTYYNFQGTTEVEVGTWQASTSGVAVRNCRVYYIPYGVITFNGLDGVVDTTSLVLPVRGISASNGATFDGEVHFLSGISSAKGITAQDLSVLGPLTATTIGGTVITASSYFSGTLVGNATNSLACSGNAATSTSTTNITISASSTDADLSVPLVDILGGGSANSLVKVDSGAGNNGIRYNPGTDLLTLGGVSAGHGATFGAAINLSSSGVRFSDGTTQTTAAAGGATDINTAVFNVQASSSISTGKKTLSMHRVPYNATITGFEVQASKAGGFTAAAHIAGPDWGNPLIGGITGASLALTGLTGFTNSLNHTSITGGNFLYLDVYSNASGATAAQAFLTYQRS